MEIGVDIVKIDRFNKMFENKETLKKHFTDYEIDYILSKGSDKKVESLAGIFACKESVLKALGLGIFSNKLSLKDIEVNHNDGKPFIVITSKLFYYLQKVNGSDLKVSISHDGEYAISECIVYWYIINNIIYYIL